MKKRFFLFLPLLGMLLGGCSGGINPVTGISLDKTELSIMETESYSLSVSIEPKKATNQIIKWETSNPNIATVSTGGVVTGISTGTADVKVITEDGGYTATCAVTVTPYVPVITHVTNIALSKQTIKLEPSASETVTYTVFPEDASEKGVTISSSNEEVVTVEDLGNNQFKINAVNEGKAAVLVISKDTPEEGKPVIDGSVAVDVYKEDDPSVIHVSSVGLSSPSASMLPNEDVDVTYTVYPSDATDKSVTVTNSDESVASINHEPSTNTISIHSIKNGTTTITVTANDKPHGKVIKSSIVVNVHDPIPVTGVILSSKSEQLNVGDNCTLIETVLPTDATNKNVTWESSDSSVASVENGVVSAKSIGTANISVVTEDGGFSDTCVVTVSERVRGYVYFTNNKSWENVKVHYWSDGEDLVVPMEEAYINMQHEHVYRGEIVITDNYQFTDGVDNWTTEIDSFEENAGFYVLDEKDGNNNWKVGKWSVVPYNIVYNANGGTGVMNPRVAYNSADNGGWGLDENKFVKDGYVFDGWATSAIGDVVYKNKAIVPNDTITEPGKTLNLFAKWSIPEPTSYKVKVDSNFYDLTLKDDSEYVTVSDVSVHSGEVVEFYKDNQKIDKYVAKDSPNNNCWNDNGTVRICLDITAKIYVNVSDNDDEKTIFCGGLEYAKYYLSVNNVPSVLTPNGTTFDGYNEFMLLGYTFNDGDIIKCVDTHDGHPNAHVFAIKIVNPSSINYDSFRVVEDGILYNGSSVNADVYVKLKMNLDEIYFGPHSA